MSTTPDSRIATQFVPSPNHDARDARIDILLLHYTGMETAEAALARLTDKAAKVSSHYFVYENGRVVQLVAEARRAWHAGVSSWKGETNINARSIGIEVVNPGHEFGYRDFPHVQIEAVIGLCRDIIARRHIADERVLAHSDIAPTRKNDPGERFPWSWLAAEGVGVWVEPAPIIEGAALSKNSMDPDVETLQRNLVKFGYALKVTRQYDELTESVVTAFQRHFRPERVDGIADASTVETLKRLLTAPRMHR